MGRKLSVPRSCPLLPFSSPCHHRTVYELCSGEKLEKLEFPAVRGLQGVKEATVVIPVNPDGPLKNKEVRGHCSLLAQLEKSPQRPRAGGWPECLQCGGRRAASAAG